MFPWKILYFYAVDNAWANWKSNSNALSSNNYFLGLSRTNSKRVMFSGFGNMKFT